MNKIKAIIFDLDGVIIKSEELWTAAGLLFLKNEGIKVDQKHYERTIKILLLKIPRAESPWVFYLGFML